MNGRQSTLTNYFPQSAYYQLSLGRIVFIFEDRDRDLNLTGYDITGVNELGFSKPICQLLTDNLYRLLCSSNVTVANPRSISADEYLIITSLILKSNNKSMPFSKPLKLKFENFVRK
jgi:hypothetical protein